MTVAAFTGFEADSLEVPSLGTNASLQSTIVRSGGFALKQAATPSIVATGLGAALNAFRVYFYLPTTTGAFPGIVDALDVSSGGVFNSILNSDNTIRVSGGGTNNVLGTHPVTVGGWTLIEYAFDVAAGGVMKAWVNGILDINTTHVNLTNNLDKWRLAGLANPNEFYFDDVRADTGTLTNPGRGSCIARQGVAGTPTYNAWTKNGAATAALCWSNTGFSTSTNCSDNVLNDAQTMLVAPFSTTQAPHGNEVLRSNFTINACKVVMVAKTASAGNTTMRRRVGGGDTDETKALTTTDTYYQTTTFFTDTVANLDAYEIGVANAQVATLQTVEDMWLMVDFTGDDLMPQIIL